MKASIFGNRECKVKEKSWVKISKEIVKTHATKQLKKAYVSFVGVVTFGIQPTFNV